MVWGSGVVSDRLYSFRGRRCLLETDAGEEECKSVVALASPPSPFFLISAIWPLLLIVCLSMRMCHHVSRQ